MISSRIKMVISAKAVIRIVLIICFLSSSDLFASEKFTMDNIPLKEPPSFCESLKLADPVKCMNNSVVQSFGCNSLEPPSEFVGGLTPYLPMAICLKYSKGPDTEAVMYKGCKVPMREQYLVLAPKNGKSVLQLIKSKEAFRQHFAPVSTPQEALSYAVALTGYYPMNEFSDKFFIKSSEENGMWVKNNLKPTEIVEKKDGWKIRLFSHTECGCNPPEVSEIELFVNKNGELKEEGKRVIWKANRNYQVCID